MPCGSTPTAVHQQHAAGMLQYAPAPCMLLRVWRCIPDSSENAVQIRLDKDEQLTVACYLLAGIIHLLHGVLVKALELALDVLKPAQAAAKLRVKSCTVKGDEERST